MNHIVREIFRSWNWPGDGSDTITARPTPYNISSTKHIPLSSVYRSWHFLFEKGYVRKVILLPSDCVVHRRLIIFTNTNYVDFRSLVQRMNELYFLELVHYGVVYYASGAMSTFKDGEGIIAAEVLSAYNGIAQKQAGLMLEFMSNGANSTLIVGDHTSSSLKEKLVAVAMQLSYRDLYEIRTANIASDLNVSHRTAQRLINSVLKERLVFAYPILNQSVIKGFNTAVVYAQVDSQSENSEISEKLSLVETIFERYLLVKIVNGTLSMLIYYDTQGELDECVKELQSVFKNFSVITRFETYLNEEWGRSTADKILNAQRS